MGKFQAIPTEYKGYKFRSRLEARWAVFFDAMDVEWIYEPEGFMLSDGTMYLPDFYLPDIETWVEVKGDITTTDEDKVINFFREEENAIDPIILSHRIVMVGEIPPDVDDFVNWAYHKYPLRNNYMYGFIDFPYLPCVCPTCGRFGFEFDGRGARICRHDNDDKGYSSDHPRIKASYSIARKARFEHGETPIIGKVLKSNDEKIQELIKDIRNKMNELCPDYTRDQCSPFLYASYNNAIEKILKKYEKKE